MSRSRADSVPQVQSPEQDAAKVPPPAADRTEARRNQVLDAATTCFVAGGFHRTSMQELAKAARMSVGHIYHYFANKEAIIEAIVQRDLDDFLELIEELYEAGNPAEGLVARTDEGVDVMLDPTRAALRVEVLAEGSRNARLAAAMHRTDRIVRDQLRAALASARPAGTPPNDGDLDARIEVMLALFEGLTCRRLQHDSLDRDAIIRMTKVAMRALFTAP